jgi:hypothetical protein
VNLESAQGSTSYVASMDSAAGYMTSGATDPESAHSCAKGVASAKSASRCWTSGAVGFVMVHDEVCSGEGIEQTMWAVPVCADSEDIDDIQIAAIDNAGTAGGGRAWYSGT